jgi:hypothetical protein
VPTAKDPTVLMSKVVLDEPEGYRGRRRHFRFPFARKAGGAAVPALLVAASIVVVLIVVGVSQLLPKQAAGLIPFGAAPGNAADNNTDGAQPQPTGPDGSPLPASGKSGKPNKSASGKPSPGASAPNGVPTDPQTPTPTPTTPPPTFSPVAIEAESATLGGAAKTGTCTGCQGTKVRFLGTNTGWLTFNVNAPAAVKVQLTFWYIAATTPRTFYINVNGGGATITTPPATVDWNTPKSATVPLSLSAGANAIKFYNPNSTANAPDLDRISIKSS